MEFCDVCNGGFIPITMNLKDTKKHSIRYQEDTSDGHPQYYGVIYHSKVTLPDPPPSSYILYVPILVTEL